MPSSRNRDCHAKFLRERALGVFSQFYEDTQSASVFSAKLSLDDPAERVEQ
jgi:hypothetical protein